jgi:TIR domain/AAA ATPase domain
VLPLQVIYRNGVIFISHSSKDKAAAIAVHQRLLIHGFNASQLYLDSDAETGIPAGSKWEPVLYARLKDCRALIVLCSANWQESKWCFAELVFAKVMGKEIFPVLLEECTISQVVAEHQAVYPYKEGEAAYERLWNVLDNRHLGPRDEFGWPPKDGDHCPFPGLQSFDERFAGVYFGREPETQTLLEALRKMRANGEPRLLMIVGGSGSGKSSLLKAGILPRLKHKTSDSDWVVLPTLRYGEQPNEQRTIFDQLAVNVAEVYPKYSKSTPDWKILRTQLVGDDVKRAVKAFVDNLQDLTLARNCSDATVLIAIDQFEELLAPSAGPIAAKLLRFLSELLHCRSGQLLVMGTMRSDHLDIYEQSPNALQTPYFQSWRLGPFPSERIEEVIRKPADRANVAITDELVQRLKRDSPTAEALPLLAFTLEKLYRGYASAGKLELQDYVSLGGMEGSIQTCVERIVSWNSLPPAEAAALRLAFVKYLAQVNEKGEIVRLRAPWDDLPAAAKPILEKFVNQRLLIRSEDGTGGKSDEVRVSIEVAHESMFRCWSDLRGWLRTSVDVLRWRREVRRDQANDRKWTGLRPAQLAVARDWPIRRRDELTEEEVHWINRGILWERIRLGIVSTVVLVITVFAGIAWWLKNEADNATLAAQHALTNSFFRTIGVSIDDIPRGQDREANEREAHEREALWELAELNRANANVREDLLNLWLKTGEAFMRGDARGGRGFRAAIGLSLEFHRLYIRGRAELSHQLLAALENPQETDFYRLSALATAVAALGAEIEPQTQSAIASRVYERLAVALENAPEVGQDAPSPDISPDEALVSALEALEDNVKPQMAAVIAKGLAAALENPREVDSTRLYSLGGALVAMAKKVRPQDAPEFANEVVAALEKAQETNPVRIFKLGDTLVELTANITEARTASAIARRGAGALGGYLKECECYRHRDCFRPWGRCGEPWG